MGDRIGVMGWVIYSGVLQRTAWATEDREAQAVAPGTTPFIDRGPDPYALPEVQEAGKEVIDHNLKRMVVEKAGEVREWVEREKRDIPGWYGIEAFNV